MAATNTIKEMWDYYLELDDYSAPKSYTPDTKLIQTKWGQLYRKYCPPRPGGGNFVVGCGGVALGQILKYWDSRVFPDNSISYTPPNFSYPIEVNFYDQSYSWDSMSNTLPDDHNQLLLYHSAASIRTSFGSPNSSSSSSDPDNVPTAFRTYWGFGADNVKSKFVYDNHHGENAWKNLLMGEINAGRPIFYAGYNYDGDNAGHAWVVDGYNGSNHFHCNWGWSSQYDGWYTLTSLNPGNSSFNDGQRAVTNIRPLLSSGIDGEGPICGSFVMFQVSRPTSASVVWSNSCNLFVSGGNTNNYYLVRAPNNHQNGSCTIEATIYNSVGQVFRKLRKNLWVGLPTQPTEIYGFPYNGYTFTGSTNYYFSVSPHSLQTVSSFEWSVGGGIIQNGAGSNPLEVLTNEPPPGTTGNFDLSVRVGNTCGSSPWLLRTGYVIGSGGLGLLNVSPNPASVDVTISEVEPSNDNIPWVLRLMSGQGAVMVNVTATLPRTINVQGLQPGVYVLHARRGQYVEQQVVIIE